MPVIDFAKPSRGIDQLSDETSLIQNTVRSAENIMFDKDGNYERREGYTLEVAGLGYHSLYSSKRGWLLICNKNVINVLDPNTYSLTPLVNMTESYLTSFTELNGNLYYINPGSSGMIRSGETTARTLGVHLPSIAPQFAAGTDGMLPAGTYGLTYSIVDDFGEESGTGPVTTVTLEEQGSIDVTMLSLITDHKWRIYMTTTDGEELYQATEVSATYSALKIHNHRQERQPDTLYLEPLPKGYIIRSHGSRLMVATKDNVYYSSAFRPHLYNPAHDYFPIEGFAYMMEPVESGVFISDSTGVKFYRGADAKDFTVIDVSEERAVFNSSTVVSGKHMNERFNQYDEVVVWLSKSGYQVGLPSGEVVPLHNEQVNLPNYVQGCSTFLIHEGKKMLVTPVQSNELDGSNIAIDSSILF